MSEDKFKEAKSALTFSQSLVDSIRAPQMAEMGQEEPMEEEMEAGAPAQEMPQEEAVSEPTEVSQEKPEKEEDAGIITKFMNEVRALFKGKEDEEKKTQDLVEKHNKDVDEIKQGLKELIDEDREENTGS